MTTDVNSRRVIGDDATYSYLSESAPVTGAHVTDWVKVMGPIIAGIGGDATSVDAVLEISIPDAAGAPSAVVVSDPDGTITGADVSLGKTADIYDLPAPVYARWNISAVAGGGALPFIAGKGW